MSEHLLLVEVVVVGLCLSGICYLLQPDRLQGLGVVEEGGQQLIEHLLLLVLEVVVVVLCLSGTCYLLPGGRLREPVVVEEGGQQRGRLGRALNEGMGCWGLSF